jgi:hypothetical protein
LIANNLSNQFAVNLLAYLEISKIEPLPGQNKFSDDDSFAAVLSHLKVTDFKYLVAAQSKAGFYGPACWPNPYHLSVSA